MFVVANLLITIAKLLELLIQVYSVIVIAAALVTWINPNPCSPAVRMLRSLTEPLFYRLRKRFPFLYGSNMDFTPLAVLLVLQLINGVVVQSALQMAAKLS